MKVILFTVPGVQPIIGNVVKEDEEFMNVEYPVIVLKEETYLYTMPYVPFAKGGLVAFNKDNIISISGIDEDVLEFYKMIVAEMKENKLSFKKPQESKKELVLKQKSLH